MKPVHVLGALLLGAVGWLLWSQMKAQKEVRSTQGSAPAVLAATVAQTQSVPKDEFSEALGIAAKFFDGVMTGINTAVNRNKNYTP